MDTAYHPKDIQPICTYALHMLLSHCKCYSVQIQSVSARERRERRKHFIRSHPVRERRERRKHPTKGTNRGRLTTTKANYQQQVQAIMDADYLNALTTICGFNDATVDVIYDQGLEEPASLVDADLEEVIDGIKGMRKAHSGDPDINFPLPAVRHLEAFALWCQDTDRRGFVPESHNFDAAERDTMSKRVKELRAYKRSEADKPEVKALADMSEYRTFIEAFENLLTTIRGAATAPLTYILSRE
jgi:hypothetical protein